MGNDVQVKPNVERPVVTQITIRVAGKAWSVGGSQISTPGPVHRSGVSQNGRFIVFPSDRRASRSFNIWRMRSDGTDPV